MQKVVVLDTPDADAPAPDVSNNTGTPQATEQGRASNAGGQQQPSGPGTQNPSVRPVLAHLHARTHTCHAWPQDLACHAQS